MTFNIRDRIQKEDLFNIGTFVPWITAFMMVFLGFQFSMSRWSAVMWIYEIAGVILLCLQQYASRRKITSEVWTLLLGYGTMEHILIGALMLSILVPRYQDIPSLIFLCALLALPLSLVDRVWRMCLFILANELLLVYISYSIHDPALFSINRNLSILYLVVSYFLYMNICCRTVQHMSDKMFIEMERDTDELTRVLNRRAGKSLIMKELAEKNSAALFMIDIDYFKRFNDTYGHAYGDVVLRRVAGTLRGVFRRVDIISRYGGDEFIVLMLGADEVSASSRAREIRELLLRDAEEGKEITLSIGIAMAEAADHDLTGLMERADQALYRVKENGRDGYELA